MKKLTKTLLINWFYYQKITIDFDMITYITGKNSSGKSTFLDALTIVLLGEVTPANFNKAANEKSQRSIQNYLRADIDENNPDSRKGKDFNTYIACEFCDTETQSQFTAGIIFECHSDGNYRYSFFTFDGPIPAHCFVINKVPMDISTLRQYLKSEYKSRQEIYDTGKRYRESLMAKWNVHNNQIFSMLKKGASFKPINDIKAFITENICDVPDKPDIVAMQQNIREYRRLKMVAKRQQEKLAHLEEISQLYHKEQRALHQREIHEYLMMRADVEREKNQVRRFEQELEEKRAELKALAEEYLLLDKVIEELDIRSKQLSANSSVLEQSRLEEEKSRLAEEKAVLDSKLLAVMNDIRTEAMQWEALHKKLRAIEYEGDMAEALAAAINRLDNTLKAVAQCAVADLANWAPSVYQEILNATESFKARLDPVYITLTNKRREIDAELLEVDGTISSLAKGVKDYPAHVIGLRRLLQEELRQRHQKNIAVDILADVLEVKDARWRGALEGYLNTRKFYLLVAPEYYVEALAIYDKNKKRYHGAGLVDLQKSSEQGSRQPVPNSLATKVFAGNPLVQGYVNYLLGGVVCCDAAKDLRNHKTAITDEGMLYQGFVARAIDPALMNNGFIGKKAIELRLAEAKRRQAELKEQKCDTEQFVLPLRAGREREFLFTQRYVSTTLLEAGRNINRLGEIETEKKEIEVAYAKLEKGGLLRVREELDSVDKRLAEARLQKETCSNNKALCENRLHELEFKILPEHCQQMQIKEDALDERFSPQYREQTGEPRYNEEEKNKTAKTIHKNFGDRLEQSKREYDTARRQLVFRRRDYVNAYPPCPYAPDSMDNGDFDKELHLLQGVELPQYLEKIKKAYDSALEQFQNDFLARLKSNIDAVETQVKELNKAIGKAEFGTDKYRFIVKKNPDYAEYYDMIMDPVLMENSDGLSTLSFQNRYGSLIEDLFGRIVASDDKELNARKQSELQENIERYTDYRTYLHFDLQTTDQNGNTQLLSETLNTKSGGETQTPFYVAILASFAQIYRVYDKGGFGNTVRLAVFDEAFNKMDSDRIIECVRLFRKIGLQAIYSTPPEKLSDIMPEADKTVLVMKRKYQMYLLPWSKEIETEATSDD